MSRLSVLFSGILVSLISITAFGVNSRTINGSCANLDISAVQKQELERLQAETIQQLNEVLNIRVVQTSSKVQYTGSSRITGPDIDPWLEVRGQAQILLKTSKGSLLEVQLMSKFINSSIYRKFHPYDAWTDKPGFNIGFENVRTQANDNEGNVRGSAVSCRIHSGVHYIKVINKATGISLLNYGWGVWERP